MSYDARLAWTLRRRRFDVVIDFHGGPRSSLLTWATGGADADRLRHSGPGLGLHRAAPVDALAGAAASLRPQSVGSAGAARHRAARRWAASRGNAGRRAQRPGTFSDRLASGRRRRRRAPDRDARERRQSVPALAAGALRRRRGHARPRRPGAADYHQLRSVGPRRRRSDSGGGSGAGRARPRRRSFAAANSICRSCGRWPAGRRCTSAATAGRCTSRPRRRCRSSRCSGRRCRNDRCRGGSRRAPLRSTAARCRAGRATSGTACPATFAV